MRRFLPIILIVAVCAAAILVGLRLVQRRSEMTGPSLTVRFLEPSLGGGSIIRTPEGVVLVIDPGSQESAGRLKQYLTDLGFKKLVLLISNPARERAGAVRSLVESVRVSALYRGERSSRFNWWKRALGAAKQNGVREIVLKGGDIVKLSRSCRLEVLSPPLEGGRLGLDEDSLVIRLLYGRRSFLFTADIGLRAEARMIRSGKDIQSDVMTVPRGGRRGATSLEFLSMVRPEICVIDVRTKREPADSVLERLATQNTGADVFRTDERGTVTIRTNGRSIVVDAQEADRG